MTHEQQGYNIDGGSNDYSPQTTAPSPSSNSVASPLECGMDGKGNAGTATSLRPKKLHPSEVARRERVARSKAQYPPRRRLPRAEVYNGTNRPLLWRFGYAFKGDVAAEYVKHHKLKLPLNDEPLDEAPTWEEVENRRKRTSSGGGMFAAALYLMAKDLSNKSGVELHTAQTLAFSRNFVVYLWTNYNYDEQFWQCPDYDFALDTLDEALRPFSGVTVKPLWYIDLENDCLDM